MYLLNKLGPYIKVQQYTSNKYYAISILNNNLNTSNKANLYSKDWIYKPGNSALVGRLCSKQPAQELCVKPGNKNYLLETYYMS